MAWSGEPKRHSEAAHKAWRTKRRNAKLAAAKKAEAAAKAARTRASRAIQQALDATRSV